MGFWAKRRGRCTRPGREGLEKPERPKQGQGRESLLTLIRLGTLHEKVLIQQASSRTDVLVCLLLACALQHGGNQPWICTKS